MLVGRRRQGMWLVITVTVVLLACLLAAWYLQYHRQANPQQPLHEQTSIPGLYGPAAIGQG